MEQDSVKGCGASDPVREFYESHPYPPPVTDLESYARTWQDGDRRRVEHHRIWPTRPFAGDLRILVAGCGTSQAARHAIRHPDSRVVGIDVSETSIAETRALARRHRLDNLDLRRLAVEDVAALGEEFDLVVCTGVIHHLADPVHGLTALGRVLAPGGAINLMVYARYGRTGIEMIQDYCRRLGVRPTPDDIADLVATLRELPPGHPLSPLLRSTPDFRRPDALADALLNPRERSYSVPELFALLEGAGLTFGRWLHQAPYLPDCGALAGTPHGRRVAALAPADQFAAVELFRGSITRHSLIAYADDDRDPAGVDFADPSARSFVPLRPHSAIAVRDRLPPGAAAALLNRAHTDTDLVMFVDEATLAVFEAVDGERALAEIGADAVDVCERLWRHDLVVIDASRSR